MPVSFEHSSASRPHWWIVIIAGLLTLVFGTVGVAQYDHTHHPEAPQTIWSLLDAAYAGFQMLLLNGPDYEGGGNTSIKIARWLGVFTLVATTWLLVWNRLQHETRLLRMARWTGHHIICGLGEKGLAILECIRESARGARIVIIDPDPSDDFVERCQRKGVCIIRKDAADPEALLAARVRQAAEIVAVTASDEANLRIAAEVRRLRHKRASGRAVCRVHLSTIYLPGAFERLMDNPLDVHTTLRFFDVYDNEARRLLLGLPRQKPLASFRGESAPLDGSTGIARDDPRSVHMVILGMGRMGASVAVRGMKMGHFANRKPLRISVVDRQAGRQRDELFFRYPVLAAENDICQLAFHQMEADSYPTRKLIEAWADEPDTLLHIFICLDSNTRAGEVGLRLWDIIADREHCHLNIRMKTKASLAGILEGSGPRVQAFGMVEDTCAPDAFRSEQNEACARVIHADFVRSRLADHASKNDPALLDWDHLRDDLRESVRQQADHMAIKIRAIGCRIVDVGAPGQALGEFTEDEIELLAELEHRRWTAEHRLAGWRYGPGIDSFRRIHNWLICWEQLPNEIKDLRRQRARKMPRWLSQIHPAKKVVRHQGKNALAGQTIPE